MVKCTLIETWATESQILNSNLAVQAIKFIENSDRYRKHSIDDYIPGLMDELKNISKNDYDLINILESK